MFKAKIGIRGRILLIALAPSLALIVTGAIVGGLLVVRGTDNKDWAARVDRDTAPGIEFTTLNQEERRLTLLMISGDVQVRPDLAKIRARVDSAVPALIAAGTAFAEIDPGLLSDDVARGRALAGQLPAIRQRADAGVLPVTEAAAYFDSVISLYIGITELLGRSSPTPGTSTELATAARLLRVAESVSRGDARATAALVRGDLSAENRRQYAYDIGSYRTELAAISPHLPPTEQSMLAALTSGPAWRQLSTMEDAIVDHADVPSSAASSATAESALPLSVFDWQDAATQVSTTLLGLWRTHFRYALHSAEEDGTRALHQALLDGIAILLITLTAFLVAMRLSARLIRRLRRLRQETLELADHHLPEITARLREGRHVDTENEVRLDFGEDEIGQVADAFNRAQAAAVSAAVAEARTRAGVNAVFLNIAYRSQLVIHRQLAVLDKAERDQEDPAQLELLFQLDHLATRARRNAENLIILGGGQPGRQWRTAVPLVDLVRSAVAETEQYQRVTVARVPEVSVAGNAVADLIHLLAELVDNATAFSPPESSVEVTVQVVGKGIAVDITDQGLGIPEDILATANESLRNPPDFSVSELSDTSRLGLFVVAHLARRHRATVRLSESPYGGIRATVVLPTALITGEPAAPAISSPPEPPVTEQRRALAAPGPASRAHSTPLPTSVAPMWDSPSTPIPTDPSFTVLDPTTSGPDERPQLPRRRRQANLAPELMNAPVDAPDPDTDPRGRHRGPDRTADQVRDLMSAIEVGTRQGRQPISKEDPS